MAVHSYSRKKDAVEKHYSLHPEGRWHLKKMDMLEMLIWIKKNLNQKKKLVKSQNKYTASTKL